MIYCNPSEIIRLGSTNKVMVWLGTHSFICVFNFGLNVQWTIFHAGLFIKIYNDNKFGCKKISAKFYFDVIGFNKIGSITYGPSTK